MLVYKASKIDRSITEGMTQHDAALDVAFTICERIRENTPCSEFYEILVSYIFDKLYPRADPLQV